MMMRFTVEALVDRGVRAGARSTCRWSATCAAASATAATASSARRSSAATGRSTRTTTAAPLAGGARSCDREAEARGLEVRLLRRLPADAARLRGRAAAVAERGRDRLLPRGDARARSRARTTCRWSRARSRPPHDAERIQRGPRARRRRWSRSAPARPPAASRRCATSPTSRSSSRVVYAPPEYISTLATSTPIAAHVAVDFELRGCPIDKRQLLEVVTRVPARPQAGDLLGTASASSASDAATSA